MSSVTWFTNTPAAVGKRSDNQEYDNYYHNNQYYYEGSNSSIYSDKKSTLTIWINGICQTLSNVVLKIMIHPSTSTLMVTLYSIGSQVPHDWKYITNDKIYELCTKFASGSSFTKRLNPEPAPQSVWSAYVLIYPKHCIWSIVRFRISFFCSECCFSQCSSPLI